jgi:hypothetical protein
MVTIVLDSLKRLERGPFENATPVLWPTHTGSTPVKLRVIIDSGLSYAQMPHALPLAAQLCPSANSTDI